jgi:hypothetical protein
MTSLLLSVTLLFSLLVSLFLVSLYNLKVLRPALESLKQSLDLAVKAEAERSKLLSQALTLLSTKDPIAYQMVQAVNPEPMSTGVYTGPYVTGEEYQELLNAENRMAELWKNVEEGTDL